MKKLLGVSIGLISVTMLIWLGIRWRNHPYSKQSGENDASAQVEVGLESTGASKTKSMAKPSRLLDNRVLVEHRQAARQRIKRLESFDCPDYLCISSNLAQAGVNIASLPMIAPRIYADLLRVKQFEEMRHTYEDRLTNVTALETISQSEEMKALYLQMQEKGLSIWSGIVSNQLGTIVNRLEYEAGVSDAATQQRILALRPNGVIPDLGMTNGILRE